MTDIEKFYIVAMVVAELFLIFFCIHQEIAIEELKTGLMGWRSTMENSKRLLKESEKSRTGAESSLAIWISQNGSYRVQIDTTGDSDYVSRALKKALDFVEKAGAE